MKIKTATLGYPRIGKNWEVKKVRKFDAKCNHEPLVNFNRDNSQNQSKFDVTKLTVTRYKKDQKPGRLSNSD
ncbi:MAG: hypothetical protein AAFV71_31350 [Cyanobacteria bacterium J06633_8]